MNETTTGSTSTPSSASPSSSVAVAAVSAAAAATAGAAAEATANDAASTSVKLLIKASNQQFDDQIIESDLLWSVKRLKTQLSLEYPGKPAVADQKLIYSGQLLNDTLQLKDVIRSYKDVYTHNHIFHLVYTPKNAPSPNLKKKINSFAPNNNVNNISANMSNGSSTDSNSSTSDGLRQRYVGTDTMQRQQQQQQQQEQLPQQQNPFPLYAQMMSAAATAAQCPHFDPNNPQNTTMPFSLPGQFNMQAMATQQAAMYNWMQLVYSQYMDQYMRLTNGAGIANISTPNTAGHSGSGAIGGGGAMPVFPPNSLLQQMPFILPNAAATNTATGAVPSNPVIPFPSATATAATFMAQPQATIQQTVAPAQVAATPGGVAPAVDNEQQQQQQQQVAAPRFPNIVQEEQDNRDWLDSFFSITRLAIFLTILYFNSSPLRCLAVVVIAGGIYLYHIGVLRLRNERNNNNINRNNNAAVAAVDAADQIRQGVQQVQQAQAAQQQLEQAAENEHNDAINDNAALADESDPLLINPANADANDAAAAASATEENAVVDNADNNASSVISFVRTFVVTFFTSLLPETPAL